MTTLPGFVDRPHPGLGEDKSFNRLYVLDIGGERLVIQAATPAGAPERVTADMDAILASISIEAP